MALKPSRLRTVAILVAIALPFGLPLTGVPATALGQPTVGFWEASEGWQILNAAWQPSSGLVFAPTDTLRVNVTSFQVDWLGNAAPGGARLVTLEGFDGSVLGAVLLSQVLGGPPFRYTAAIDLGSIAPALQPGWYYVRVFIDDNARTWSSVEPILVGAPGEFGSIRTYTDETFATESDVFSATSLVWVRIVGRADQNPDVWDLAEFLNGASAIGGPRGGFDNFRRTGSVYTFSVDLGQFPALLDGWYYTLGVLLRGGAFAEGKLIQIFDPTVSVSWANIAPAMALQGQTDVPMLGLRLSLDANWALAHGPGALNFERIRVTRVGAGVNADIAGVRVYRDANGNGAIDAGDVLIGAVFNLAGVAFPVWVGTPGTTMSYLSSSAPLDLIVAYDVSPTATVGNRDGAQINAGDIQFAGNTGLTGLPAMSGTVQILAAPSPITTVTNDPGVAPGAASRGQANVPIDLLTLSTNGPLLDLSGLDVNFTGTVRTDVTRVALYADDGDGAFNPPTDVQVATGAFPATGPVGLTLTSFHLTAAPRALWIVYDIGPTATIGDAVGSQVSNTGAVRVSAGTVFNQGFPLGSGMATISGPVLTVTGIDLAPASVRQGRANAAFLELDLTVIAGSSTVSAVRIDKTGTSALDADVVAVKIWRDTGNGVFDIGDTLLGSGRFIARVATIGSFTVTITAPTKVVLFVTYDVSLTVPVGDTVGARLASPTYLVVDPDTTVTGPFPLRSSDATVIAGGPGGILTVAGSDLTSGVATVSQGQTGIAFAKLAMTVDANFAVVQGLRVDKIGSSPADADVAAVRLYLDANGNGSFDTGDTLFSTTTFVARVAIFSGLNVNVTVGSPKVLFIVLDISPTATLGQTVGIELRTENYVSVVAPSSVDPANFPIRSSTPAIAAATSGTLSGRVVDANGNPIQDSTVLIVELGRSAATDANGMYSIPNVPFGTYSVTASKVGYQTAGQSVTVSGVSATANFTLPLGVGPTPLTWVLGVLGLLALVILSVILLVWKRRRKEHPPTEIMPPAVPPEDPPPPPPPPPEGL